MSIKVSKYELLPQRRDGQVSSNSGASNFNIGSAGGGSVDNTMFMLKDASKTGYVLDLPFLYNDSSIFQWIPETSTLYVKGNVVTTGEVQAWSLNDTIDIPSYWSALRYLREASLGTTLYWKNGLLEASGTGGGGTWGSITGTLSNQTDLNNALNAKAPIASPTFAGTVTGPYYNVSSPTGYLLRDNTVTGYGIYKGASDRIGIAENGSEVLSVKGGNVGIGITWPSTKLDVNGAITINAPSAGAAYQLFKYNNTDFGLIGSDGGIYGAAAGNFGMYVYGNNSLEFSTNNNRRLVIDGAGKILSSGDFEVNGSSKRITVTDGTNSIALGQWDGVYNRLENAGRTFLLTSYGQDIAVGFNGYGNALYIKNSNNYVGIGNASPNYALDVNGIIANTSASGYFYTFGRCGFANAGNILVNNGTGENLLLKEIANSRYSFTNGGSVYPITMNMITGAVGINATDPQHKFQINGVDGLWSTFMQGTTTTSQSFGLGINAGTNANDKALRIQNYNASAEFLTIRGDGNVGIGTAAPNKPLHLVSNNSSYGQLRITNPAGSGAEATINYTNNLVDGYDWVVGMGTGSIGTSFGWYYAGNKLTLNTSGDLTATGTVQGNVLRGTATAHPAGANAYNAELYSDNTGDPLKYVSLRFHQGSQYWGQIRYSSSGFRLTGGADDVLNHLYLNNLYASGEVTAFYSSDASLKTNIKSFSALDIIHKLNPVQYNWNDKAVELNSSRNTSDSHFGFIAQDVLKTIPQIVKTNGDYLALEHTNKEMVAILWQAVKELSKKVNDLERDCNYYKNMNN